MSDTLKIPDQIFETRCRWCMHGNPDAGNKEIPAWWVFAPAHRVDLSCKVMSVSRPGRIAEGECETFAPHVMFGLCDSCRFNSMFNEPTYCKLDDRKNYRPVFIGARYGDHRKAYDVHRLCTCDNYKASPYWADIMRRDAAAGKIPRNFDPDTMKPIGEMERNLVAEKWAKMDEEQRRKEAAEEKIKETREPVQEEEQIGFADEDYEEDEE